MAHIESPEMRLFERFGFAECASVTGILGGKPISVVVVDIGLGGMQIRSKERLPANDLLVLRIPREDKSPIAFQGRVRYSYLEQDGSMYVSGYKFSPQNRDECLEIVQYVHNICDWNAQLSA